MEDIDMTTDPDTTDLAYGTAVPIRDAMRKLRPGPVDPQLLVQLVRVPHAGSSLASRCLHNVTK